MTWWWRIFFLPYVKTLLLFLLFSGFALGEGESDEELKGLKKEPFTFSLSARAPSVLEGRFQAMARVSKQEIPVAGKSVLFYSEDPQIFFIKKNTTSKEQETKEEPVHQILLETGPEGIATVEFFIEGKTRPLTLYAAFLSARTQYKEDVEQVEISYVSKGGFWGWSLIVGFLFLLPLVFTGVQSRFNPRSPLGAFFIPLYAFSFSQESKKLFAVQTAWALIFGILFFVLGVHAVLLLCMAFIGVLVFSQFFSHRSFMTHSLTLMTLQLVLLAALTLYTERYGAVLMELSGLWVVIVCLFNASPLFIFPLLSLLYHGEIIGGVAFFTAFPMVLLLYVFIHYDKRFGLVKRFFTRLNGKIKGKKNSTENEPQD